MRVSDLNHSEEISAGLVAESTMVDTVNGHRRLFFKVIYNFHANF